MMYWIEQVTLFPFKVLLTVMWYGAIILLSLGMAAILIGLFGPVIGLILFIAALALMRGY